MLTDEPEPEPEEWERLTAELAALRERLQRELGPSWTVTADPPA